MLVLTFTWTNFLEETDEGLRLRDAFSARDSKTWLTSLRSNQNLSIQTPPKYAVSSTPRGLQLEDNAVVVEGPRTFDSPEQLAVSYYVPPGVGQEIPWELIGGGVVVVLIVGLLYLRRRSTTSERTPASPPESEPRNGAATEPAPAQTDEQAPEAGAEEGAESEDPDIDLDLLSDEERVELLLEQNGGRMKQANIVKETGWSDAKVSQLLSSMADEGQVEKLRLGRENLISLPDEDEETE